MQKTKLPIVILALSIALASCNSPGGSGHSFIDQPLQGKIGGTSWLYVSGTANDLFSDGNLWVNMYDIAPATGDPWVIGAYTAAQDKILVSRSPSGSCFITRGLSHSLTGS